MTLLHCPAVNPTDQENIYPLADSPAIVRIIARGARAVTLAALGRSRVIRAVARGTATQPLLS